MFRIATHFQVAREYRAVVKIEHPFSGERLRRTGRRRMDIARNRMTITGIRLPSDNRRRV